MVPSGNSFASIPFDLNNNLQYFVKMDKFNSATYSANVQLRPRFTELTATISSPSYTKLDTAVQNYPFSLLKAYQGSSIQLNALLNKEITNMELYTSANSIDSSTTKNRSYSAEIYVNKQDTI